MDCSTPGSSVFYHSNSRPHPLSPLSLLPSIFSSLSVFSNDLALHIRWPKHWSFSVSPSYSGLISLRIDRSDLPAVQETLKRLLQHNSQASVFQRSAFSVDQLHTLHLTLYTMTGKTRGLTIQTFLGKVTSLLFNMLLRYRISTLFPIA